MNVKTYKNLGETLYTDILPNGLTVYYLPKPDYHKTFGLFTTNFGSLDTRFGTPLTTYPEGIAHFLEHKLFEKADGDVMYKFGSLGAQTNAFTSFNRTAYLFYTAERAKDNITLLLDFVQTPYFTEENVAKEQGIITQEIQMYQDDPDWRLYAGLLASLYPDSPLAADIAGTPSSIHAITPSMLYENHLAFYQPANMNLFLTGPFDVSDMSALVRENQATKDFSKLPPLPKRASFAPAPAVPEAQETLDVAQPKVALGIRGTETIKNPYRFRLSLQLFTALTFGATSDWYETHYHAGDIDDSFSTEFEMDGAGRFHCLIFSADTDNPEHFIHILQERLKNYTIDEDALALIKKQMLGRHLASLNSLEFIANEFAAMPLGAKETLFDLPDILQSLSATDIQQISENFLKTAQESIYTITPKD
ncbi:MAG: insulinase family protein [Streptococcaceae bacterium]|jgi:predicted Zn-dependent peptidase|nr:insulinase family protein [Streptococcaceae bacterium]